MLTARGLHGASARVDGRVGVRCSVQDALLSASYEDWGLNLFSSLHVGFVTKRKAQQERLLIVMGIHQHACNAPLGWCMRQSCLGLGPAKP
jgi:hypothetical protein